MRVLPQKVLWIRPLAAYAAGIALAVVAFLGPPNRADVFAILAVGFFLHPAIEWAIAGRLEDFWSRMRIQAESFDAVWGSVHRKQDEHTARLDRQNTRLDEHDGILEQHKRTMEGINATLKELLSKIEVQRRVTAK